MSASPHYTAMVARYWTQHRPQATALLPDPQGFFQDLGAQINAAISSLALQMQGTDRPGETTPQKVGRLHAITDQARERVLAELLYGPFPPELDPPAQLEQMLAELPSPEMVREDLFLIEEDAMTQARLDGEVTVTLTEEQHQRRRYLLSLATLLESATRVQVETMSPEQASTHVNALRPFWAATTTS